MVFYDITNEVGNIRMGGNKMKMKNAMQRSICVIGHKNPDTDSICSAIAYANLKNLTSERSYEPRRAGEINQETAFVLEKFHMEPPEMCLDVHATVSDIDIRYIDGRSEERR